MADNVCVQGYPNLPDDHPHSLPGYSATEQNGRTRQCRVPTVRDSLTSVITSRGRGRPDRG